MEIAFEAIPNAENKKLLKIMKGCIIMKKIVAMVLIVLAVMSILMLSACGSEEDSKTDKSEASASEDVSKNDIEQNEESDDEAFIVPTENKGTIKEGVSINSNEVTISGKTYAFPVKISDLLSDGWYLSDNLEFDNEFGAKGTTSLIGFSLYHEDGSEISLSSLYNDSDEVKKFEECILTGIEIYIYDNVDFVFPGGITNKSTAADVLAVYGDPNETTDFDSGYNLNKQLTYVGNKETGFRISYVFNEVDGTLYAANIEIED